jgi:non-heme chloroperoxidase
MNRRNLLQAAAAAGLGLVTQPRRADARPTPASTTPASSFVATVDGASLFYRDWGRGRPVMFVHGWSLHSSLWEYQMTHLAARGLRCIACDLRGHGRSSQPGRGHDFDTLADDLAAVIDYLDVRNVVLVSHSMSAGVAARYLTRHRARRVSRAVFMAPLTPFPRRTADNPEGLEPARFEQVRADILRDRPQWHANSAPAFFGVGLPNCSASPEMMQWAVRMSLQSSLKALLDIFQAYSETDFRHELPSITVPTLILHGDGDKSAPLARTADKTAALIRGSVLKVYQNAPHGLVLTHKAQVNADLVDFIGR